jgi:putative ABC transport system ATP-binding protein
MAAAPLIELKGITKVYGKGEAEVRALDGLDLRIDRGEFVAVMGPSGSGKSTAMNIMGYLDAPTAGSFLFDGVPVAKATREQRTLLRRNFLGFVFQGYNLLSQSSALENVELPMIYRGVPRTERRHMAQAALDKVGMGGREHHLPSQLSGGQQQRVAIARAIVTNPLLLLADEPTGNLDTERATDVMKLLVDLNQRDGITIVMVTHEPDMASYCRRQVRVVDGKAALPARTRQSDVA